MKSSLLSSHIQPFHVMELVKHADRLTAQGRDVIHLSIGEPDFALPHTVEQAMIRALRHHQTRYTPALGIDSLRQAISMDYTKRFDVSLPMHHIAVTPGASGALQYACLAVLNPGDQVLLPDPGYPCNKTMVQCAGALPVPLPVVADEQFQPTLESVKHYWTSQTKALLMASPANPTGTRIDPIELRKIALWIQSRGGYLIMDEIYQSLCYSGRPESVLQHSIDLLESGHLLVVNSFSKYFGMTGLRLGWLIAPTELMRGIEKLCQNLGICPSTPAQWAALSCFEPETLNECERRKAEFAKRRELLLERIPQVGLELDYQPDSAFYLYLKSPDVAGMTGSNEYCLRLLEQQAVCTVPGMDFSELAGAERFRMSYANSLKNIETALDRIQRFNQDTLA